MTTLHVVLYSIALFSQVIVISILLPRQLVGIAGADPAANGEPVGTGRRFRSYLHLNRFVAPLGVIPVLLAWMSDFEDSLTLVLLTTGIYFFVQVGALVSNQDIRKLLNSGVASPQRASRALVFGALAIYVAYVAISLIYQNESSTSTWVKIEVVTLANAFFVAILLPGLVRMRRESSHEKRELSRQIGRSINVLATISIGLSIYFFGKDLLADLDVSTLRPLVMSVFLQALALFAVRASRDQRAARRALPGPQPAITVDDHGDRW